MKYKVGFVGCGNMASGMIRTLAMHIEYPASHDQGGLQFEYELYVTDKDNAKTNQIKEEIGAISVLPSVKEIAKICDIILICVKPDAADAVLSEISDISQEKILISIMAGKKLAYLMSRVKCAVVRAMPNLAAQIGGSMTAVSSVNVSGSQKEIVSDVLRSTGFAIWVEETKMDAVTAVSGSGIAYVFYFIDSMISAGIECGLTYDEAHELIVQTFAGGAAMCMYNHALKKQPINEMVDAVCSKGGTTIEAIDVLRANKTDRIIASAVNAAYQKSKKMSGQ